MFEESTCFVNDNRLFFKSRLKKGLLYATSNLVRLTSPTWRFFGVNEAPKTIVVNGNHLEFHQYFSIYCKTRYLIHLTTCNEHILTTSDQNSNLIAHIIDSFDSFFHLLIKLANELLQKKNLLNKTNSFYSILPTHPHLHLPTHTHPQGGDPQITKNTISLEQIEIFQFCLKM